MIYNGAPVGVDAILAAILGVDLGVGIAARIDDTAPIDDEDTYCN